MVKITKVVRRASAGPPLRKQPAENSDEFTGSAQARLVRCIGRGRARHLSDLLPQVFAIRAIWVGKKGPSRA
jgi:hypothetical protein